MLKSFLGVSSLILCAVLAVSLPVSADAGGEVYVVSSNLEADAYSMSTSGDGTFSPQEILHLGSHININAFINTSFANGLGDFDKDGDLDYIMATWFLYGQIYISQKNDAGNQFAGPQYVGTWGAGQFARDFAVADFNGDGLDDFVLSLSNTTASGLYINTTIIPDTEEVELDTGEVTFEFRPELLSDTAASDSTGADAADFNGDGRADFVIASTTGKFFVSLNDGDVNDDGILDFTTVSFDTCDDCAGASGIAAADFNGDGIVDIAVAGLDNKLDIYAGGPDNVEVDGDFTFTHLELEDEGGQLVEQFLPSGSSAIDNYDFDGDEYQDLVVASDEGVVVLWGGEGGIFDSDVYEKDSYLGGSGYGLNAVSAPPWVPTPEPEPEPENKEPVAVIEPADLEATVGEKIEFNGSNSFDEDGDIVSWEWDFGDAVPSADVPQLTLMSMEQEDPDASGVNPSHTFQQSGDYKVILWVTDDRGSTSSAVAQVKVMEPEPQVLNLVRVKFSPHKIHHRGQKGKGKAKGRRARSLSAKLEFPEGYDARNVDRASVCIVPIVPGNASEICARGKKKSDIIYKLSEKFSEPRKSVTVKFDREAVLAALACPPAKKIELTVRGTIILNENESQEFEGTGHIRLKKGKKSSCKSD